MFKIESYITPWLFSYLNDYFENLNPEDVKLSIIDGQVKLFNLDLKIDVLQKEITFPLDITKGHVHELVVNVPYTALASEPIVINLNLVEFTFKVSDNIHPTLHEKIEAVFHEKHDLNVLKILDCLFNLNDLPQHIQKKKSSLHTSVNHTFNNLKSNLCDNLIVNEQTGDYILDFSTKSNEKLQEVKRSGGNGGGWWFNIKNNIKFTLKNVVLKYLEDGSVVADSNNNINNLTKELPTLPIYKLIYTFHIKYAEYSNSTNFTIFNPEIISIAAANDNVDRSNSAFERVSKGITAFAPVPTFLPHNKSCPNFATDKNLNGGTNNENHLSTNNNFDPNLINLNSRHQKGFSFTFPFHLPLPMDIFKTFFVSGHGEENINSAGKTSLNDNTLNYIYRFKTLLIHDLSLSVDYCTSLTEEPGLDHPLTKNDDNPNPAKRMTYPSLHSEPIFQRCDLTVFFKYRDLPAEYFNSSTSSTSPQTTNDDNNDSDFKSRPSPMLQTYIGLNNIKICIPDYQIHPVMRIVDLCLALVKGSTATNIKECQNEQQKQTTNLNLNSKLVQFSANDEDPAINYTTNNPTWKRWAYNIFMEEQKQQATEQDDPNNNTSYKTSNSAPSAVIFKNKDGDFNENPKNLIDSSEKDSNNIIKRDYCLLLTINHFEILFKTFNFVESNISNTSISGISFFKQHSCNPYLKVSGNDLQIRFRNIKSRGTNISKTPTAESEKENEGLGIKFLCSVPTLKIVKIDSFPDYSTAITTIFNNYLLPPGAQPKTRDNFLALEYTANFPLNELHRFCNLSRCWDPFSGIFTISPHDDKTADKLTHEDLFLIFKYHLYEDYDKVNTDTTDTSNTLSQETTPDESCNYEFNFGPCLASNPLRLTEFTYEIGQALYYYFALNNSSTAFEKESPFPHDNSIKSVPSFKKYLSPFPPYTLPRVINDYPLGLGWADTEPLLLPPPLDTVVNVNLKKKLTIRPPESAARKVTFHFAQFRLDFSDFKEPFDLFASLFFSGPTITSESFFHHQQTTPGNYITTEYGDDLSILSIDELIVTKNTSWLRCGRNKTTALRTTQDIYDDEDTADTTVFVMKNGWDVNVGKIAFNPNIITAAAFELCKNTQLSGEPGIVNRSNAFLITLGQLNYSKCTKEIAIYKLPVTGSLLNDYSSHFLLNCDKWENCCQSISFAYLELLEQSITGSRRLLNEVSTPWISLYAEDETNIEKRDLKSTTDAFKMEILVDFDRHVRYDLTCGKIIVRWSADRILRVLDSLTKYIKPADPYENYVADEGNHKEDPKEFKLSLSQFVFVHQLTLNSNNMMPASVNDASALFVFCKNLLLSKDSKGLLDVSFTLGSFCDDFKNHLDMLNGDKQRITLLEACPIIILYSNNSKTLQNPRHHLTIRALNGLKIDIPIQQLGTIVSAIEDIKGLWTYFKNGRIPLTNNRTRESGKNQKLNVEFSNVTLVRLINASKNEFTGFQLSHCTYTYERHKIVEMTDYYFDILSSREILPTIFEVNRSFEILNFSLISSNQSSYCKLLNETALSPATFTIHLREIENEYYSSENVNFLSRVLNAQELSIDAPRHIHLICDIQGTFSLFHDFDVELCKIADISCCKPDERLLYSLPAFDPETGIDRSTRESDVIYKERNKHLIPIPSPKVTAAKKFKVNISNGFKLSFVLCPPPPTITRNGTSTIPIPTSNSVFCIELNSIIGHLQQQLQCGSKEEGYESAVAAVARGLIIRLVQLTISHYNTMITTTISEEITCSHNVITSIDLIEFIIRRPNQEVLNPAEPIPPDAAEQCQQHYSIEFSFQNIPDDGRHLECYDNNNYHDQDLNRLPNSSNQNGGLTTLRIELDSLILINLLKCISFGCNVLRNLSSTFSDFLHHLSTNSCTSIYGENFSYYDKLEIDNSGGNDRLEIDFDEYANGFLIKRNHDRPIYRKEKKPQQHLSHYVFIGEIPEIELVYKFNMVILSPDSKPKNSLPLSYSIPRALPQRAGNELLFKIGPISLKHCSNKPGEMQHYSSIIDIRNIRVWLLLTNNTDHRSNLTKTKGPPLPIITTSYEESDYFTIDVNKNSTFPPPPFIQIKLGTKTTEACATVRPNYSVTTEVEFVWPWHLRVDLDVLTSVLIPEAEDIFSNSIKANSNLHPRSGLNHISKSFSTPSNSYAIKCEKVSVTLSWLSSGSINNTNFLNNKIGNNGKTTSARTEILCKCYDLKYNHANSVIPPIITSIFRTAAMQDSSELTIKLLEIYSTARTQNWQQPDLKWPSETKSICQSFGTYYPCAFVTGISVTLQLPSSTVTTPFFLDSYLLSLKKSRQNNFRNSCIVPESRDLALSLPAVTLPYKPRKIIQVLKHGSWDEFQSESRRSQPSFKNNNYATRLIEFNILNIDFEFGIQTYLTFLSLRKKLKEQQRLGSSLHSPMWCCKEEYSNADEADSTSLITTTAKGPDERYYYVKKIYEFWDDIRDQRNGFVYPDNYLPSTSTPSSDDDISDEGFVLIPEKKRSSNKAGRPNLAPEKDAEKPRNFATVPEALHVSFDESIVFRKGNKRHETEPSPMNSASSFSKYTINSIATATMSWTYPEPRSLCSVVINPLPFCLSYHEIPPKQTIMSFESEEEQYFKKSSASKLTLQNTAEPASYSTVNVRIEYLLDQHVPAATMYGFDDHCPISSEVNAKYGTWFEADITDPALNHIPLHGSKEHTCFGRHFVMETVVDDNLSSIQQQNNPRGTLIEWISQQHSKDGTISSSPSPRADSCAWRMSIICRTYDCCLLHHHPIGKRNETTSPEAATASSFSVPQGVTCMTLSPLALGGAVIVNSSYAITMMLTRTQQLPTFLPLSTLDYVGEGGVINLAVNLEIQKFQMSFVNHGPPSSIGLFNENGVNPNPAAILGKLKIPKTIKMINLRGHDVVLRFFNTPSGNTKPFVRTETHKHFKLILPTLSAHTATDFVEGSVIKQFAPLLQASQVIVRGNFCDGEFSLNNNNNRKRIINIDNSAISNTDNNKNPGVPLFRLIVLPQSFRSITRYVESWNHFFRQTDPENVDERAADGMELDSLPTSIVLSNYTTYPILVREKGVIKSHTLFSDAQNFSFLPDGRLDDISCREADIVTHELKSNSSLSYDNNFFGTKPWNSLYLSWPAGNDCHLRDNRFRWLTYPVRVKVNESSPSVQCYPYFDLINRPIGGKMIKEIMVMGNVTCFNFTKWKFSLEFNEMSSCSSPYPAAATATSSDNTLTEPKSVAALTSSSPIHLKVEHMVTSCVIHRHLSELNRIHLKCHDDSYCVTNDEISGIGELLKNNVKSYNYVIRLSPKLEKLPEVYVNLLLLLNVTGDPGDKEEKGRFPRLTLIFTAPLIFHFPFHELVFMNKVPDDTENGRQVKKFFVRQIPTNNVRDKEYWEELIVPDPELGLSTIYSVEPYLKVSTVNPTLQISIGDPHQQSSLRMTIPSHVFGKHGDSLNSKISEKLPSFTHDKSWPMTVLYDFIIKFVDFLPANSIQNSGGEVNPVKRLKRLLEYYRIIEDDGWFSDNRFVNLPDYLSPHDLSIIDGNFSENYPLSLPNHNQHHNFDQSGTTNHYEDFSNDNNNWRIPSMAQQQSTTPIAISNTTNAVQRTSTDTKNRVLLEASTFDIPDNVGAEFPSCHLKLRVVAVKPSCLVINDTSYHLALFTALDTSLTSLPARKTIFIDFKNHTGTEIDCAFYKIGIVGSALPNNDETQTKYNMKTTYDVNYEQFEDIRFSSSLMLTFMSPDDDSRTNKSANFDSKRRQTSNETAVNGVLEPNGATNLDIQFQEHQIFPMTLISAQHSANEPRIISIHQRYELNDYNHLAASPNSSWKKEEDSNLNIQLFNSASLSSDMFDWKEFTIPDTNNGLLNDGLRYGLISSGERGHVDGSSDNQQSSGYVDICCITRQKSTENHNSHLIKIRVPDFTTTVSKLSTSTAPCNYMLWKRFSSSPVSLELSKFCNNCLNGYENVNFTEFLDQISRKLRVYNLIISNFPIRNDLVCIANTPNRKINNQIEMLSPLLNIPKLRQYFTISQDVPSNLPYVFANTFTRKTLIVFQSYSINVNPFEKNISAIPKKYLDGFVDYLPCPNSLPNVFDVNDSNVNVFTAKSMVMKEKGKTSQYYQLLIIPPAKFHGLEPMLRNELLNPFEKSGLPNPPNRKFFESSTASATLFEREFLWFGLTEKRAINEDQTTAPISWTKDPVIVSPSTQQTLPLHKLRNELELKNTAAASSSSYEDGNILELPDKIIADFAFYYPTILCILHYDKGTTLTASSKPLSEQPLQNPRNNHLVKSSNAVNPGFGINLRLNGFEISFAQQYHGLQQCDETIAFREVLLICIDRFNVNTDRRLLTGLNSYKTNVNFSVGGLKIQNCLIDGLTLDYVNTLNPNPHHYFLKDQSPIKKNSFNNNNDNNKRKYLENQLFRDNCLDFLTILQSCTTLQRSKRGDRQDYHPLTPDLSVSCEIYEPEKHETSIILRQTTIRDIDIQFKSPFTVSFEDTFWLKLLTEYFILFLPQKHYIKCEESGGSHGTTKFREFLPKRLTQKVFPRLTLVSLENVKISTLSLKLNLRFRYGNLFLSSSASSCYSYDGGPPPIKLAAICFTKPIYSFRRFEITSSGIINPFHELIFNLVQLLSQKYVANLYKNAAWIIGSFDIIGCPAVLVSSLKEVFLNDLITPPSNDDGNEMKTDTTALISKVTSAPSSSSSSSYGSVTPKSNRNIPSKLLRALTSSILMSVASFCDSLSRNLDTISFDTELVHLKNRRRMARKLSGSFMEERTAMKVSPISTTTLKRCHSYSNIIKDKASSYPSGRNIDYMGLLDATRNDPEGTVKNLDKTTAPLSSVLNKFSRDLSYGITGLGFSLIAALAGLIDIPLKELQRSHYLPSTLGHHSLKLTSEYGRGPFYSSDDSVLLTLQNASEKANPRSKIAYGIAPLTRSLFTGISKGLIGAVVKPLGGVTDLLASSAHGLLTLLGTNSDNFSESLIRNPICFNLNDNSDFTCNHVPGYYDKIAHVWFLQSSGNKEEPISYYSFGNFTFADTQQSINLTTDYDSDTCNPNLCNNSHYFGIIKVSKILKNDSEMVVKEDSLIGLKYQLCIFKFPEPGFNPYRIFNLFELAINSNSNPSTSDHRNLLTLSAFDENKFVSQLAPESAGHKLKNPFNIVGSNILNQLKYDPSSKLLRSLLRLAHLNDKKNINTPPGTNSLREVYHNIGDLIFDHESSKSNYSDVVECILNKYIIDDLFE